MKAVVLLIREERKNIMAMAMLELIELIMKRALSLALLKTMVILFVMLLLTLRIVFCPLSVLEIKGNMQRCRLCFVLSLL